jgi:hypothetical protein
MAVASISNELYAWVNKYIVVASKDCSWYIRVAPAYAFRGCSRAFLSLLSPWRGHPGALA